MEKKANKVGRPYMNRTSMNVRIDNRLIDRLKKDGASDTINKALWEWYVKNV